ncbi:MAG: hypothetical protein QW486_07190, partial [Candidatus Bathyarchaeia archaeon]
MISAGIVTILLLVTLARKPTISPGISEFKWYLKIFHGTQPLRDPPNEERCLRSGIRQMKLGSRT